MAAPCGRMNKLKYIGNYWIFILLIFTLMLPTNSLHIRGKFESKHFFKFMDRFGFQQTDMHDKSNTQGYIYGNITTESNSTHSMTFVVVDSEYFLEYYDNRSVTPRSDACRNMFRKIDTIAWDSTCNQDGKEDFLRKVPCPKNELCVDEDTPKWVIPGYQFTYRVQDTSQPRLIIQYGFHNCIFLLH